MEYLMSVLLLAGGYIVGMLVLTIVAILVFTNKRIMKKWLYWCWELGEDLGKEIEEELRKELEKV